MSELTWENVDELYDMFDDDDDAEDAIQELCESSRASDFLFHCADEPDVGTIVSVVPEAFFRKNGYMYDGHLDLSHLLPPDMSDEMECVWLTDGSVNEVEQEMTKLGFKKDAGFDKLLGGG